VAETYLREDFAAGELTPHGLLPWARATALAAPRADIYREREGRRTLRLRRGGRGYFLKYHGGIGWAEVLRNLLRGRLPVTGAENEYRALRSLAAAGLEVPRVAAYAGAGRNPARRRSVVVTDALQRTVSLEDYCAGWGERPPPPGQRAQLVRLLAQIARRMHAAGINHRDFYLCHFHLRPDTLGGPRPTCYLIDLHRAQQRRAVPLRWRVKDLAGLYFSAMDCGLRRRDLLRFMHHYSDGGLRAALGRDAALWRRVSRKARRLYGTKGGRLHS